ATGQAGPSQRLEQFCTFDGLQLGRSETSQYGHTRRLRHQLLRRTGFPGVQLSAWQLSREFLECNPDHVSCRILGYLKSCGQPESSVSAVHQWFTTVPTLAAERRWQPDGNDCWLRGQLENPI